MADRATKGTTESVIGGERVMDALEIADAEEAAIAAWDKAALAAAATGTPAPKPRQPNPLLLDLDPDRYILEPRNDWMISIADMLAFLLRSSFEVSFFIFSSHLFLYFFNYSRYLLTVLRRVKRPDLEEALLVLPFHLVEALVRRLANLLDQAGLDHELVAR